ncbi:hypothetical protein D7S86_28610 [Pararobbsia silviterrae]|uniref:Uncharacterized protein n=1 Tax=Pararobbsia silviterrae TaxID=1792498 RepID=A0A494WZX7_9BURK|nr:hypothetical protein D7S86_28610 [Pararobbsia silviterrae]
MFVKVIVRGVPVRAALVPVSLTESTSDETLADIVVGEADGVVPPVDVVVAVAPGEFDPPHAANAAQMAIAVPRSSDFFKQFMTRPVVCAPSKT